MATAITYSAGSKNTGVVVLAGAASRRNDLDRIAEKLRTRGVEVHVVVGVERSFAPMLQVSFVQGARARYLICGGPEFDQPTMDKLVTSIESNGVPRRHVWAGRVAWDNLEELAADTVFRLSALGLEIPDEPVGGSNRKRAATLVAVVPHSPPIPGVMSASTSGQMSIPAPSGAANGNDDDEQLRPPVGPIRRMMQTPVGMASMGAALVLALGLGTLGLVSDDDAEDDPGAEVQSAAVVVAPDSSDDKPAGNLLQALTDDEPTDEAADEPLLDDEDEGEEPPESQMIGGREPTVISAADGDLVYDALKRQSIRAIDILLVSEQATKKQGRHERPRTMRHAEAEQYCASLVVDGVGDWRLPHVGELGWISKANVIRNGTYWTLTRADAFGNDLVVWNARRRRMSSASSKWKGGRTICVRFQRSGDGPE